MPVITRRKRAYFFDSQPDSSGDKFRTKNIPTEIRYSELFQSQAFILEPEDSSTITQRGLIKLYSDAQAIQLRYTPTVTRGDEKGIQTWQLPGLGIKDENGDFIEAQYDYDTDTGTPVQYNGVKIEAVKQDSFTGIEKMSYQIQLDIDTAPEQIVQEVIESFTAGTLICDVQHDFNNKWVEVDVYNSTGQLIECEVELVDANNVRVNLNSPGAPDIIDVVVHGVKTI